ncbi:ABC transporter permease [Microbacterium sp. RU33B]|uniref:ABC transporter permease n=1 Tax=Microbacterium sp. RU33B TaxID=1907390 RepID=UPI000961AA5E|nr:ABC transporter permease [Microbacterium sp. RU33B]SIT84352.1 NitT/TauT family transport system permease protein [Microbacterium sp. RU33B]
MTAVVERPTTPPVKTPAVVVKERRGTPLGRRIWAKSWPPLLAVAIVLVAWQALVLAGVKPSYVLPDPLTVITRLGELATEPSFWVGVATTMTRAVFGFAVALVIGTVLGAAVARSRILRSAIGALLSGLQTMPSIAWFPLAILFFGLTEQAILFVIVLGAAPSIANGLISGIDDVPPSLLRAGHTLGARGFQMLRFVILPAALPTYVAGLKQGWAFAWRSLLAGELLVTISQVTALGVLLSNARSFADAPTLLAVMIVILIIGMLVDGVFSSIANGIRRRRGLGSVRL